MDTETDNTYIINNVENTAEGLVRMLSPALTFGLTSPTSNPANHIDYGVPSNKTPFLIGVSGGTASGKVDIVL